MLSRQYCIVDPNQTPVWIHNSISLTRSLQTTSWNEATVHENTLVVLYRCCTLTVVLLSWPPPYIMTIWTKNFKTLHWDYFWWNFWFPKNFQMLFICCRYFLGLLLQLFSFLRFYKDTLQIVPKQMVFTGKSGS